MQNPRSFRCLATVLVLALFLAAPWPAAARPSEAPPSEVKARPIHLLLVEWLEDLWGDAGCTFDPSGGCRDGAAPTEGDPLPGRKEGKDRLAGFDMESCVSGNFEVGRARLALLAWTVSG